MVGGALGSLHPVSTTGRSRMPADYKVLAASSRAHPLCESRHIQTQVDGKDDDEGEFAVWNCWRRFSILLASLPSLRSCSGLDCARREISSSFQEPSSLVLSPKAVMETTPTRAFQKGRCTRRRRLTQRYRQRLAGLSWNVYVTERNHFPRFPGNFPPGKKKEKPISIDQLGCDSRLVDTFWK